MALSFALDDIESNKVAALTNYGEFLEKHPPEDLVEIVDDSSWSCVHGVERWRSDCGCNSGGHAWNQQWRAPLRAALDWLSDRQAPIYESRLKNYLKDPWLARDEYIRVILDRSEESRTAFFAEHAIRPLDAQEQVTALKLLEMQRHAMLMYTSCGWFFDELSGIETVQVIHYAGRALAWQRNAPAKRLRLNSCNISPRPRAISRNMGTALRFMKSGFAPPLSISSALAATMLSARSSRVTRIKRESIATRSSAQNIYRRLRAS